MRNPYLFNGLRNLIAAGAVSAVLVACGGASSTGPTYSRALFIDDAVSGLSYSCASTGTQAVTGTTDTQGGFNYLPGQTCTFSVGKVTLGSVSAIPVDGKVTPQDVAGVVRSATSSAPAVTIAQFLQSLKDPASPSGQIVISQDTRDALNASSVSAVTLVSDAGSISPADLQDLVVTKAGKTLVSSSVATAALAQQISSGNVSESIGVVSASAPVVLKSIAVTSAAASNAKGLSAQLTATGFYSDGSSQDLTAVVAWTSANTNLVTVDASGKAKGVGKGAATITASYTPSGSTTAISGQMLQTTTDAVLQSIAITNTASPPEGTTDPLTATGTYSDGTTADLSSSVTWASSDQNKVTVNTSGVATGVAVGEATVTASYTPTGGVAVVSPGFTERVKAPTVINLVISYVESGLTYIQKGASAALQAIATLSNNATQTVSSLVDWSVNAVAGGSGAGTVAKNSTDGTANATLTGTTVGDLTVFGTYSGITSNSLNLTVKAVISGVAASGAPMDNADVTVTCSDGSTKTGTTDSAGAFSIDVGAGCPAPYVLVASNTVGDAKQSLVSVQPAAVNGPTTVNITPLTNALSATLATNGDPLTLASAIVTEKNNITATAVNERNTALVASLSSAMAAAGVSGTPNLISTTFSADRTGMDKVLDNLKVVVGPSGVSITNPAASKVDDMANVGSNSVASNLSSASITINKNTNFSAGLTALPATMDDASVVDAVQSALNACFTLSASERINTTTGVLLGKCADLATTFVATDYKHDGKTMAEEFARWMTGTSASAYDNAKFLKPEIVRFYSNSASDARALVRFGLQRTDGVGEWFMSVAEKSTNTGGTWKLRGNQRLFKIFVNGYVVREEQLQNRGTSGTATYRPKGAYYHSGINFYFGINAASTPSTVKYVKVTGPGLPDTGIYLRYYSGCDFNYALASSATAANGAPTACTSTYRMQYRKASVGDPENNATQNGFVAGTGTDPFYAQPAKSDADVQGIAPFSAYRFEIFYYTNTTLASASPVPDLVYVERLRSRPLTLGNNAGIGSSEVDKLVFNTGLDASIKTLIDASTAATAFTGGTSFTLRWNNVTNAPPVNSVQIQSRPTAGGSFYQDETNVKLSATSVVLRNGSQGWGNMSLAGASGTYNFVQLRGRDMNDLQYFQNWRY